MIHALFTAGVDVFRLNFSHGAHARHHAVYAAIREVERAAGRDIEFMVGNWAQCPAAAFVPALLQAVWKRAIAVPASEAVS